MLYQLSYLGACHPRRPGEASGESSGLIEKLPAPVQRSVIANAKKSGGASRTGVRALSDRARRGRSARGEQGFVTARRRSRRFWRAVSKGAGDAAVQNPSGTAEMTVDARGEIKETAPIAAVAQG